MKIYRTEVLPKLKDHQYAYLPSLGTTDALVKLVDDWTKILDSKDNFGIQSTTQRFLQSL